MGQRVLVVAIAAGADVWTSERLLTMVPMVVESSWMLEMLQEQYEDVCLRITNLEGFTYSQVVGEWGCILLLGVFCNVLCGKGI